jgi:pimeloyl-ACP methyl ester carboxylesterase
MENPASSGATPDTESSSTVDIDTVVIQDIPNRPEGEYLSVNGAEIYYEIFGEGEPLLLIHGGAATIESWFFQIPEFAGKFKLIVPDARGHGRSRDVEGPIDFKNMAADFAALLDHLGIPEAMVVGWSDGGVTGLQMAIDRPDLISKVVTLGAHSRPEGMTDQFKAEIEGATPENFPAILSEGYKALSPDGPEHWPVVFGKLRDMWLTLPNFTEEELKSIDCPVLLLVGEQDIVRPEESDRLTQIIPDARLVTIEGASHYSPVEVPDVVNGIITEFLTEE